MIALYIFYGLLWIVEIYLLIKVFYTVIKYKGNKQKRKALYSVGMAIIMMIIITIIEVLYCYKLSPKITMINSCIVILITTGVGLICYYLPKMVAELQKDEENK